MKKNIFYFSRILLLSLVILAGCAPRYNLKADKILPPVPSSVQQDDQTLIFVSLSGGGRLDVEAVRLPLLDPVEFLALALFGQHDPVSDYRLLGVELPIGGKAGVVMHDVGVLAPLNDEQRPIAPLVRDRQGRGPIGGRAGRAQGRAAVRDEGAPSCGQQREKRQPPRPPVHGSFSFVRRVAFPSLRRHADVLQNGTAAGEGDALVKQRSRSHKAMPAIPALSKMVGAEGFEPTTR